MLESGQPNEIPIDSVPIRGMHLFPSPHPIKRSLIGPILWPRVQSAKVNMSFTTENSGYLEGRFFTNYKEYNPVDFWYDLLL